MHPLGYAFVAVLGLVIGSFLNVVIWRVPRGESVVTPRSACPACGAGIAARDNVPVVSWLLLRGRCRACGERISARYPLVEAGTAAAFVATAAWAGLTWELPAYLYLAAIGIALALIDLELHRLPDRIVLPSYPVVAVLLAVPAIVDARGEDYLRALLGGAALFAFYFVLALIKPRGMGGGDIKLAGILGMYLGWVGWDAVIVGGFAGFLLGALAGIVVMTSGLGGLKSALPFGPFMIAGTAIGLVWGPQIADAYLDQLPG